MGDAVRSESILWEAVRVSFSESVWPVIALSHFYQYVRGDSYRAVRLMKSCVDHRKKIFSFSTGSFSISSSSSSSSSSFSSSLRRERESGKGRDDDDSISPMLDAEKKFERKVRDLKELGIAGDQERRIRAEDVALLTG
jgi:predicted Zn-dependent protease